MKTVTDKHIIIGTSMYPIDGYTYLYPLSKALKNELVAAELVQFVRDGFDHGYLDHIDGKLLDQAKLSLVSLCMLHDIDTTEVLLGNIDYHVHVVIEPSALSRFARAEQELIGCVYDINSNEVRLDKLRGLLVGYFDSISDEDRLKFKKEMYDVLEMKMLKPKKCKKN